MTTVPSLAAIQHANFLVNEAETETLDTQVRNLINQARVNPTRIVEIVVALAEQVAAARPPAMPQDHDGYWAYLRRAHAAHARGVRLEWVVSAEREYQRQMKAKRRAA